VFKLGDSKLPIAPVSGGSQTAASVGPAVQAAALSARSKVIRLAIGDKASPLQGRKEDEISSQNDRLFLTSDPGKGESYAAIITRSRVPFIEAECKTNVSTREKSEEGNPAAKKNENGGNEGGGSCFAAMSDEKVDHETYSFQSFGAQFAKVQVDPWLGIVRVVKWVSVMDIGRVLNLKTARNQICGGIIMGLGMALMEETVFDPNRGRIVTRDLANYHVPVHADIPDIEVQFIDNPDPFINPFGGRGVGEIGITGAAAAIANAVFHATGLRIRELPITPDKLILA
jgi:xanthine dehydrogenase YagR molybdenum-binding subunit